MEYEGNRIVKCDDAAASQPTYSEAHHFADLADASAEYEYDENGNMTKDLKIPIKREQSKLVCFAEREEFGMKFNRNISSIQYNSLNLRPKAVKIGCISGMKAKTSLFALHSTRFALSLPSHIIINGDGMNTHIDNTYDAAGNKLRTTVGRQMTIGPIRPSSSGGVAEPQGGGLSGGLPGGVVNPVPSSNIITTDYRGNAIYRGDTLSMLLTEEGYVTFANDSVPVYHYYLKDHLGSIRVVFDQSGAVEQRNNYYPSGTLMYTSTNGTLQPYKFGGKELERTAGLDEYDFGARWMDPTVGARFTAMDPMSEKYYGISPYVYCGGDPVNLIDPSGRIWEDPEEAQRLKEGIEKRIKDIQNSIDDMETKLNDHDLSDKKREKLEGKISEQKDMVANLGKSMQDIDLLGNEEETVFRIEHTNGGRHSVYSTTPGYVVIQASSDAMAIHEITHIVQSAFYGGAVYAPNGFLVNPGLSDQRGKDKGQNYIIERMFKMEIDSYQRQYSYDLSFPFSIKGLYDINANNIRRIKDEKGENVYKWTDFLK